jgi:dihydroorotate dehydrogenase (fumarate)
MVDALSSFAGLARDLRDVQAPTALATRWLGLELPSPVVLGASPLTDDVDTLARVVDAGAGAIVMRSLFEEQLALEQMAAHHHIDAHIDTDAEARTFLPDSSVFSLGPEPYLRQLERIRARVAVPVIASLNGTTHGGWTRFARRLADAGASAIELNLYDVATDPSRSAADLEAAQLDVVEAVVGAAGVPVTVKLSAFYGSLPHFASQLAKRGARGVAVYNRFYQPDIDLDALDVTTNLHLSTSAELPLRLHALAILSGRVDLELACTGGVATGLDAAKAILCGATVVQVVSAVLKEGAPRMAKIVAELTGWLTTMGYAEVGEARGVMDLTRSPDPHAWERLNYMKMLRGWRPRG